VAIGTNSAKCCGPDTGSMDRRASNPLYCRDFVPLLAPVPDIPFMHRRLPVYAQKKCGQRCVRVVVTTVAPKPPHEALPFEAGSPVVEEALRPKLRDRSPRAGRRPP
jgi:hypothetical protein